MSGYLGILYAPPEGFHRMPSLTSSDFEVWARGSMFSEAFQWCYVRKAS